MAAGALPELRALCLALPETSERVSHGEPVRRPVAPDTRPLTRYFSIGVSSRFPHSPNDAS